MPWPFGVDQHTRDSTETVEERLFEGLENDLLVLVHLASLEPVVVGLI
jgi:hypothetical protein